MTVGVLSRQRKKAKDRDSSRHSCRRLREGGSTKENKTKVTEYMAADRAAFALLARTTSLQLLFPASGKGRVKSLGRAFNSQGGPAPRTQTFGPTRAEPSRPCLYRACAEHCPLERGFVSATHIHKHTYTHSPSDVVKRESQPVSSKIPI